MFHLQHLANSGGNPGDEGDRRAVSPSRLTVPELPVSVHSILRQPCRCISEPFTRRVPGHRKGELSLTPKPVPFAVCTAPPQTMSCAFFHETPSSCRNQSACPSVLVGRKAQPPPMGDVGSLSSRYSEEGLGSRRPCAGDQGGTHRWPLTCL